MRKRTCDGPAADALTGRGKLKVNQSMWNLNRGLSILLLSVTATLAADTVSRAQPFAAGARELIVRLDGRLRALRSNADVLESAAFLPNADSAKVHLTRVNSLKEDLAGIAEMVNQLDRHRGQEADWQVQLTDKLLPKVRSLTESINQAIALIGNSDQPLWVPNYQAVAGDIRDQANGLSRVVAVFLRWANLEEPEP